eukprot:12884745-Alexandrium_andersonii.AAC.1
MQAKSSELEAIRRQRSPGEWLIQRKFVLTERGQRAVYFAHPRRMGSKSGWAHFQALRELEVGTGREHGLLGVVVQRT